MHFLLFFLSFFLSSSIRQTSTSLPIPFFLPWHTFTFFVPLVLFCFVFSSFLFNQLRLFQRQLYSLTHSLGGLSVCLGESPVLSFFLSFLPTKTGVFISSTYSIFPTHYDSYPYLTLPYFTYQSALHIRALQLCGCGWIDGWMDGWFD